MARAIHPFPARMASEIAMDAMRGAVGPLTILDPMCGSGTVLSDGVAEGHNMIGYDLDPLAILMSRVATSCASAEDFEGMARECVMASRRSRATKPPWNDQRTEPFAHYWFAAPQYKQLLRLSKQINALNPSPERDVLQIALSRIIVTKSPQASLAADTAHSRPHRVITSSSYDVLEGFLKSTRELGRRLNSKPGSGRATIELRDARDASIYKAAHVDLVITSPPYLNAIDYLRGHRLALIWLGYSISQLRLVRAMAIGSEVRLPQSEEPAKYLDSIQPLLAGVEYPDRLPRHLLSRYVRDMRFIANNIQHCLLPGGQATFVVADSVLRGNTIPTGSIVAASLELAGLERTSMTTREIPAGSRYLPVNNAGPLLSNRMKREYVITARKAVA